MKPYSLDLREKLLCAYDAHRGSQRALAALFGVSRAFVENLLRRRRTTGTITPRPHAGGRQPGCDMASREIVALMVREQPDATLEELCAQLGQRRGGVGECAHHVPPAQAARAAPQNKSLHAAERDTPRVQQARARYWQMIASRDVRRLQCIDESGVNLAMTRLYGRAPKGERVVGTVPQNYGQNVTMLGALGAQGRQAVMTVEGPMATAVFRASVKHVLGLTLTPGDIVVLDNLGVHKARGIQQMLARRRVRLLYLPPYSPDLALIEPWWSKVKTALRRAKARTRGALDRASTRGLPTVTEADARGWVRHGGYALH
jgi:transposase